MFLVSVSPNWPLMEAGELNLALNTLVGPISSLQWLMASSLAKMYARIGPLRTNFHSSHESDFEHCWCFLDTRPKKNHSSYKSNLFARRTSWEDSSAINKSVLAKQCQLVRHQAWLADTLEDASYVCDINSSSQRRVAVATTASLLWADKKKDKVITNTFNNPMEARSGRTYCEWSA